MSEFKIGDIVRMKVEQGWVVGVQKYLHTPLVVQKRLYYGSMCLATTDGQRLVNPETNQDWCFDDSNLELDPFLNAVRRRRHAEAR